MDGDRELLERAARAASYVGQKRYWTPGYPGARPVECTAWNCSITASFNGDGMTTKIGAVWTNYRGPFGRLDQVWFTPEEWETFPAASLTQEDRK